MAENSDPLAGQLIGRYRLKQRIGEGGMGVVYLALREGDFQRRVALKLVRRTMANPEVLRRFGIERQTLAALNHPNIVRLIDGGATDDGLPYLVVDYIDGEPIDGYCESRKLGIPARLRLFLRVCEALQHAHRSLVVHCDLKPSNILVTREGEPMLLDFGIAKILDPAALGIPPQDAVTRLRACTPEFASPEQLRGEPASTSTDVYGLGLVLYQLLTGHTAHEEASTASMAEWVRAVCEEDPAPPGRIVPEAAGDLDAIVLKAVRRDPRERYASVEQFADDIRRHLEDKPVLARQGTRLYITRKFLRRHKLAVGAAAAVLVSLASGAGLALWQARVAQSRFDELRQLAHAFLFDVHDSIQDLPGSTTARALIARTGTEYLDRLSRNARGEPSLELEIAEGYLKVGDVQGNPFSANLGDSAAALAAYQKALAIAERAAEQKPRELAPKRLLARSHEELATVLPFTGKPREALQHAQTAVQLYERLAAAEPGNMEAKLDLARAHEGLADILGGPQGMQMGRGAEALAAYQKALSLIPILPLGHGNERRAARARAVVIMKLGDMASRRGDNQAALANYRLSLQTAGDLLGADTNNMQARGLVSALWGKIGWTLGDQGDMGGALEAYIKAVDINEASLKVDPANQKARTNVVVAQKNLGDLYFYRLSKTPEALHCYRRVAELLEAQCTADARNVVWREKLAEALTYVASALLSEGQAAEARQYARRGLEMAREVASRPGATAEQALNYAWLAVTIEPTELRDAAAALPFARRAVEMGGASDPMALHVLAQALAGSGDYRSAAQAVEKALALLPAAEPGKPVPARRATLEKALAEYRKAAL